MAEAIMEKAKQAAIHALEIGETLVNVCGRLFPLQHMHDNEYALMTPMGEVFRLVKRKGGIKVYVL